MVTEILNRTKDFLEFTLEQPVGADPGMGNFVTKKPNLPVMPSFFIL